MTDQKVFSSTETAVLSSHDHLGIPLRSLCRQNEGWGPVSPTRYDLTPCFEYGVFYGAVSMVASLVFISRILYLHVRGQPHHLGRTAWIYWPTQAAMFLAAAVMLIQTVILYDSDASIVLVLGCIGMAISWVIAIVLNRYEHIYEIRSSTPISIFYVASIGSTFTIIRTQFDLSSTDGISSQARTCLILFTVILSLGLTVEAWPRESTQVQQLSNETAYDKANIFSRVTFYFYQPIVSIGRQRTLTAADITNLLPPDLKTDPTYNKLSRQWEEALARQRCRYEGQSNSERNVLSHPPSLFWAAIRSHSSALVPIIICRLAIVGLSYTLPLLLERLLSYLQDHENKPLLYGITLACSMFSISLLVALLFTYNRYQIASTKAAFISMMYRKSLKLSPGSRVQSTTGEITNHMAQWGEAFVFLTSWISIPIEFTVALFLLYRLLGVSGMILVVPLQAWQADLYKKMQGDKLHTMDQRVRLTTEVLTGIRVVKLYGWTSAFLKRILGIRNLELLALKKTGIVQASLSIVFISSPLTISLITFGVYAMWGGPDFSAGKLTPQTVFVSMTLFAMLRSPLYDLMAASINTISVVVATRRMREFLLREEIQDADIIRLKETPKDPNSPVILVEDASFSWESIPDNSTDTAGDESPLLSSQDESHCTPAPVLQHVNLSILSGKLIAVVGRVGQGKSSLLSGIIGETYKLHGKVQVAGTMAYVPQQSWIINATLRDNILFGNTYDEERYQDVLYACGLDPDLAMLPAGDMTEIGERGINLSGGQKQRVSLARAVYDDADIYLLDDPLSAVDAHVDRYLWENVIGPSGLLQNKTRLLVTHGIHHLKEMDQIVVLKDRSIVEQGSYADLIDAKDTFYQLIEEYSIDGSREMERTQRRRSCLGPLTQPHMTEGSTNGTLVTAGQNGDKPNHHKGSSSRSETGSPSNTFEKIRLSRRCSSRSVLKDAKKHAKAELVEAEKMNEGIVNMETFFIYLRALSYRYTIVIVLLFIAAQACLVGTNLWFKYWIKKSDKEGEEAPARTFLGVYVLLAFLYATIYVVVSWLLFSVARIRASDIIHRRLLSKVLRLPMSFFDTTPMGRIINRFSSDLSTVDDKIPNKFFESVFFTCSVSSTLILIVWMTPFFLLVLPFLLVAYRSIQQSFLRVSCAVARIYSTSKSPVYQHFHETLNGVSTIRAMNVQERFIRANTTWADKMANNYLGVILTKRWVETQLRLLSTFVLLFAALFVVLGRDYMDPSMVGLTLSFTLAITEDVTSVVRITSDLQNFLISVERIMEYTNMGTEAPEHTDVQLPPGWPNKGHIQFHHYSTRYREGLDLVVKDISIDIQPSESIGIVGRTGAGKSSLALALFRIVEAANSYWAKASDNIESPTSDSTATTPTIDQGGTGDHEEEELDGGRIEIDGIDISKVGLEDLRKSISIIPQDPILFAGTVRDNLDPFQEQDDASLWEALGQSNLKDHISSLPGGLEHEVSQNGENFSVGQRSLMCLARALLRKTKILIMDEATAAVDVETDELIQNTIRDVFQGIRKTTVLTIAHRIKTVMDSDKILVLDQGRVLEFESPDVLLQVQAGQETLFYQLAKQAGEI
ncbi:hypothetical protein B0O80DRAFT_460130 [Mortierella sp. GBAus27b]|nr:hypothetical protein B0O80DRAFT_460130 [Mortierella sp. GBAus27b]